MQLTVLGRSPARPNPGEACAGYLVEGGGARVLIDAGPGIVAQLLLVGHPEELDAVVISHMHTDHFLDLVTLRYVYPWREHARQKLRIILPPGSAEQMADLARGAGYPTFWEKAFILEEHDGERPIELGNLRLEPGPTKHYVPTWGFRIEARGTGEEGALLVYTADTAPSADVERLSSGADLLLCEATLRSLEEDAQPPEPRGHLLASEAGELASRAGARRLLLTHLPVNDGEAAEAARAARDVFGGEVGVAEPLGRYTIGDNT
jgi:ribonuclease BN (tRNA processing enzyme)